MVATVYNQLPHNLRIGPLRPMKATEVLLRGPATADLRVRAPIDRTSKSTIVYVQQASRQVLQVVLHQDY
jgi:hypothetical protein